VLPPSAQPVANPGRGTPGTAEASSLTELEKELAEEERRATQAGVGDDIHGAVAQESSRDLTDEERANQIGNAAILARVTEWDRVNGFAVIAILKPEVVQEGTKLAIRRQTGIRGQLTVAKLYPDAQAVANPEAATFLGEGVDVQPGDELIAPPTH
jgi:hypothetical protein